MPSTIPGVVREAAETFGDTSAIEEGDLRLDFRELADRGLRSARAFMASGIEPGDRVAIWAPNIHEWILAGIGLQMAGATLVPLNTRLKKGEAAYILNKSGAKILCTVTDFLDVVIEGFATGAARHHHLVFKAHPLEDGRVPLRREIRRLARRRWCGRRRPGTVPRRRRAQG